MATVPAKRLAIVTGGNKGLGFEAVKQLAAIPGYRVVLCSRDTVRGLEAVGRLDKDGLRAEFLQLDITDPVSVHNLEVLIDDTNSGVLDVLINNAGMAFKGSLFGHKEAETTIKCNVLGTMEVTDRMLPYLRKSKDGRLINVCSQAGRLSQLTAAPLKDQFRSADLTRDGVVALCSHFIDDVLHDRYVAHGWSNSMYGVSKLAEIALTRVVARGELTRGSGVFVAACCPGWCATDMSSHRGPRSASKGAEVMTHLATADRKELVHPDGTSRAWFYYDCEPLVAFQEEWDGPSSDATAEKK